MGSHPEDVSIYELQAELCRAMSNALRLEIVHLLRENPMQVNEIVEATGQPQSTISRNLTKLRNARIVNSHRRGRDMIYEIANPKITDVCDLMRQVLFEEAAHRSKIFGITKKESSK
jgi:ArsR family transcriptional regulator